MGRGGIVSLEDWRGVGKIRVGFDEEWEGMVFLKEMREKGRW